MTKGVAGFIRDNLEAFAVAIAMALVIRHYCLEAFRIPTRSMKPTLRGDEPPQHGDRILVDKFVYLWRDPQRFEVVVFHFPLNSAKNYIKRLVGLPGEWLRIVDGDIWTSEDEGETWRIQRKPAGVQEQLFFPYYPEPVDEAYQTFGRGPNWRSDGAWLVSERDRRFKVDGSGTLRFDRHVLAYGAVDTNGTARPPYVGDVRVRFDVAVRQAGRLVMHLQEHGRAHRVVLGAADSHAVIVGADREHTYPLEVKLAQGDELSVSCANVDDTLVVVIDGEEVLRQEFPDAPAQPALPPENEVRFNGGSPEPWYEHAIELEAEELEATISDLRIDRDVHYDYATNRGREEEWRIPDGHYFMLGDNTRHSSDSRAWEVGEAYLSGGRVIRWQEPGNSREDPGNPYASEPVGDDDMEIVIPVDVDGLVRRFRKHEVTEWRSSVPQPFVPHENLVGRAFAIFWPIYLPPAYRHGTRVNLIR